MHFVDLIIRKRNGQALSREDVERFVAGASDGSIPDYQLAALLMAIVLRGMTDEETAWLTDAMVRSGERLDLSDLPGVKVGKHSTGGVGDKVSIALAPLAAACGVVVPKMSGRGLGHTGGTLDKLESIPGYRIDLSVAEFKQVLQRVGTSIVGQTASLVPADRALYALRDVTGTVESIPLISASIMSKKLAEGTSALVLDVKCGNGAFMKNLESARALAASMVATGARAGVRTEAFITRMDAPLGRAVGNSVEIAECIAILQGDGPPDLTALVVALASRMTVLAKLSDESGAEATVRRVIDSGAALDTLRKMIEQQGGDARVVDDTGRLPSASSPRSNRCRALGLRLRARCRAHRPRGRGARRRAGGDRSASRSCRGNPDRWRVQESRCRPAMPCCSCCTTIIDGWKAHRRWRAPQSRSPTSHLLSSR